MKTDSYTFELLRPDDIYTSAQVSSHEIFTMNFRSEYFYEYDKNGNITKITKGDDQSLVAQYEYDTLNQLTREDSADGNFTRTWSYDRIGNILDCKEYTYSPTVATDDLGVPVKTYRYDYTLTGWKDQLESVSLQEGNQAPVTQKEYERDNVGNPISDGTWTYTWQYGRQLASMENPAEEAAENDEIWYYTYNADGLRTKREHKDDGLIVGTWEYIYNGSQLVQMTKGNDTLRFTYDAGGLPMTVTHKTGNSEAIYYYVTNLQGDVIALLDQQTRAVAEYAYDAWGNPLGTVPTTGIGALNPLRYRGYVWDAETELYYLQSRYYDPEVGRFINADNQLSTDDITGLNLFAYCGNNPVNRSDPTGEAWIHWLAGAAIVAVCAAATVITCGGFAAAAGAVMAVGSGVAAATTASTIAAAAFVSSATVYGTAVLAAASSSSSIDEFRDQGNWGMVAATAGGGVLGGYGGYTMSKAQTPTSTPTGKGTQNSKVKAAVQKGHAMHKQMDYGPGVLKEQTIAPGCRVDGIDFNNRIIYELKPNNPQAIARGMSQLNRYTSAASQQFGGTWTGVLKLYD